MIARLQYSVRVGAAVLLWAGCDIVGPGAPSIAGSYTLRQVEGLTPPCCADADSAGGTVTVIAGTLQLGAAAPTPYGFPPSGVPTASSCVHGIPNGAFVDSANVVHLPDGSSYRIPPCGDAPYVLVLTRRHDLADGTTRTNADTTRGLYTWGNAGSSDSETYLTLVGSGMGGTVQGVAPGARLLVARQYIGPPGLWPRAQQYLFVGAGE